MTLHPSIRVVGPNPALDRIEVLDELLLHGVNRSAEVISLAGGKSGIVARGIHRLGANVTVYGFLGGHVGAFIRDACRRLGLQDRHVQIQGETRITSVLVDRRSGHSTVVNEPGPTIEPDEAAALLGGLKADCGEGDLVVSTGSLPQGVPDTYHGEIVEVVQGRGGRAILDTSGASLAAAIPYRPWLLKPNLAEFSELLGRTVGPAEGEVVAAMTELVASTGIAHLVVTLGAEGCLYTDGASVLRVRPPRVEAVNVTGSGDLLLAGTVFALSRGADFGDALRLGTAAAAAAAMRLEPDLEGPDEVHALLERVVVERVDTGATKRTPELP